MREYDPKDIESKWQEEWEKSGIYRAEDKKFFGNKPKWYSLVEFPYPSGDGLHVGHVRSYTAMDIISRKRRREGFNVLYPIGWDAFGLPTENYAIKTGRDPRAVTKENTDNFRKQLKSLGISFDWFREVDTTDPKYYKWTQWLFLKFLEHGLAYKAKMPINWCPKDKIGLANEEVVDGKCERCGTPVEVRNKEQWMLKITDYAERLLKDLDDVDYPERVKASQRNWIGKSEGALIKFDDIEVFTTRPDTIFGATFIVVAGKEDKFTGRHVTNPATKEKIPVWEAEYVLADYGTGAIMAVPAHDERDFEFAKKHDLPIKQVVAPYFEDSTMECSPRPNKDNKSRRAVIVLVKHWSEEKYLCLQWKKYNWRSLVTGGIEGNESIEDAVRRELLEETGYFDIKNISKFPLRAVSRFFAPHKDVNMTRDGNLVVVELASNSRKDVSKEELDNHEVTWVDPENLAEFLDFGDSKFFVERFNSRNELDKFIFTGPGYLVDSGEFSYKPSDTIKNEIIKFVHGERKVKYKLRDWVFSRQRYWGEPIPVVHCAKCGVVPVPEKDLPVLLPEVKNYQPTDSGESPLANIDSWVNTKCPKCGGEAKRETDTMPNWAGSSWYFLRYADSENDEGFASKKDLKYWMPVDWYNGGMEHTTLHLLYSRFWNKFLFDIGLTPTSEPYKKRTSHGLILAEGGEKMSKSKGNVVNPDTIVAQFGADTLRLYEMFMGPFEQAIAWNESSLTGPRRFIERVWKLKDKIGDGKTDEFLMHSTIKKVSDDIESMSFNTAVSTLMVWVNELEKKSAVSKNEYETLLSLLAPFAPHVTDELWSELGHGESIHTASWPQYDETKMIRSEVVYAIQVNGKVRADVSLSTSISKEEVEKRVLEMPEVMKWIDSKEVKRVIVVPNKVVNIVTS